MSAANKKRIFVVMVMVVLCFTFCFSFAMLSSLSTHANELDKIGKVGDCVIVGNYLIETVCANDISEDDYPLYGDIYESYDECRKEHPDEKIIFGYYVKDLRTESEGCVETPDWFFTVEDAMNWIKENS